MPRHPYRVADQKEVIHPHGVPPVMAQSAQVRKLNPWHIRLADWLIANGTGPGWNRRASAEFQVTQGWLSTVYHSDAFQEYFASRNHEISSAVALSVREKMLGTASLAMDILADRVEAEGNTMPLGALLDTVDVLAKRTGHGEAKAGQQGPPTTVQVNVVTREQLSEARALMRRGASTALTADNPPLIEESIGDAEPSTLDGGSQ